MAYLFLSQHHKTNAGESCETYCSKDDPFRVNTYSSSISVHLLAFKFATCCSFSFAFVLLNDVKVETKGSLFDLAISSDLAKLM